jgi:hypothetical protein
LNLPIFRSHSRTKTEINHGKRFGKTD